MGLSVLGAVVVLALSLFGQSSGVLQRAGINSRRLQRRSRNLTGYAFALLLLGVGFFLAGVPLGEGTAAPPETTPGNAGATPGAAGTVEGQSLAELGTAAIEGTNTPPPTPQTGAFDRPPVTQAAPPLISTGTITAALSATPPPIATAGATAAASATPAPTLTPSATPSPSPTPTPSPTLTPTPIAGETATVTSVTGGVWIKRAPNGQNLVLVDDGDIIILRAGHANYGGVMWREVSAVTGETGWLEEQYILYSSAQS